MVIVIDRSNDRDIEKANKEAFDKLIALAEFEEKGPQGNWRYYKDQFNNRYGWYTERQKDGKFHAFIRTKRKTKTRIFAKKNKAIEWAYKNYAKHNSKQVDAKLRRKERQANKPKPTPEQKAIAKCEQTIKHYNDLIKKNNSKIKALVTRTKTYQRRIRYHQKKLADLAVPKLELEKLFR